MPSNVASASLRQASRLYAHKLSSSTLVRSSPLPKALVSSLHPSGRRSYVSESKKDSAQVDVSSTIKADQKAFFAETGKRPQDVKIPGMNENADVMMSPMAGGLCICPI